MSFNNSGIFALDFYAFQTKSLPFWLFKVKGAMFLMQMFAIFYLYTYKEEINNIKEECIIERYKAEHMDSNK